MDQEPRAGVHELEQHALTGRTLNATSKPKVPNPRGWQLWGMILKEQMDEGHLRGQVLSKVL